MVVIATWLLTFSAGIHWYVISEVMGAEEMTDSLADRAARVSCLGLVVSFLAGYVALLYGGYANQNWRKADEIAEANKWLDLHPQEFKPTGWWPSAVAERLAWPCDPKTQLAPVFHIFTLLAVASIGVHAFVLYRSLAAW